MGFGFGFGFGFGAALLLPLDEGVGEVRLEALVGEVDAQLLEGVVLEVLEAEDVEEADEAQVAVGDLIKVRARVRVGVGVGVRVRVRVRVRSLSGTSLPPSVMLSLAMIQSNMPE